MDHKAQIKNKKYRNWVRAGLGLKYVKESLEPFCDHIVNQQHVAILDKVKRKHNLSTVLCGLCNVRTLQPDHVQLKTRQCPLGQLYCNCLHPRGKISCPNTVCGAIYDEIIQHHASTPPSPNWRNTDAQQWCTEPWAVAKCFINVPGYENKIRAVEFDCLGLLHVLINNIDFQQHIKCVITGTDVFSRVRMCRNDIFHSNSMELDDTDVNCYIDDMVELLEDETEIKHIQESKAAVKKLQELKQEDFIISTADEAEIRRVAMTAINEKEKDLTQTIADAGNKLRTTANNEKHDIEGKGLVVKSELEQTVQKIRKELAMKEAELEQTGQKIRKDLLMKEAHLQQSGQKIIKDLVMKETEIEKTGQKIKMEFVMKQNELKQTGQNIKKELALWKDDSKLKIEQKDIEREKQLTRKMEEVEEKLDQKLQKSKLQLENKKNLTEDIAEAKQQAEKSRQKAVFQKKLVTIYKKYVSRTSALPLKPERTQMDVDEIYISALMTVDMKDDKSVCPISIQDIFENQEVPAKCIYIIGEAGSGKSMFCKILVHFWCIAHSYPECSLDESDIVKEMKNFNFLFYISLRHCSDCDSIEKMLEKLYRDPALGDILQNESDKCLVILDGLDEWAPEIKQYSQFLTPGLPGRKLDADYTIITTSRQWKFDSLRIKDNEVDKKINLRGIDKNGIKDLTWKTITKLNDTFHKSKNAEDCESILNRRQFSDISKIPLILQQLICLWFDNKLRDNSKHAIYSSMLVLFLEWKTLKTVENQECEIISQECMIDSPLPDYLSDFKTIRENTYVIQYLSRLAYETLFDKNKENTLTFNSLMLARMNIPIDVIKYCLNAGILKKEQNVSLHASVREQSSFSFFHKSMQEYLAAVHVASQFKEMLKSREQLQRDEYDLTDVCKTCVRKHFGSCKTYIDIIEQSNVLIMLCGLEPRLLTDCSKHIYNVTLVDKMVVDKRHNLPDKLISDHNRLIKDIQTCIFKCIGEVMSRTQNVHSPIFIADLYVDPSTDSLHYCHNIILKNVLSIEIDRSGYRVKEQYKKDDKEAFYLAVKHLTNCDQLKTMKYNPGFPSDERVTNEVTRILETNVRTLETISLINIDKINTTRLVSILPKMRHLTLIQMNSNDTTAHDVCLSLGTFLNQNTSLQHITLGIVCEKYDEHMIDLSKNKKLQHVVFLFVTFGMVSCNTDSLETFKFTITSGVIMNQVCSCLYKAGKLKHLDLYGMKSIRDSNIESRTVTEDLIKLLPTLDSLSTLTLWNFTFTDNIIARPCDMKNLKEIILLEVTMSMTAWYKFKDSLSALPQEVKVKTFGMDLRDEPLFEYHRRDENQNTTAHQYVKDKT